MADQRLQSIVSRIERLNAEIADLQADKSEVFKEAKSAGYNVKALKVVIQRRAKDQYELDLIDTDVDLYLAELGDKPVPYARAREGGGAMAAAKAFVDSVPEGGRVTVHYGDEEIAVVDKRQPVAAE